MTTMLLNRVVGLVCTSVLEHYPENFTFKFGAPPEELSLAVDCLWRIISNRQVQCTSLDHGHQYGLPEPIDAYAEARNWLRPRTTAGTCRLRAVEFAGSWDPPYRAWRWEDCRFLAQQGCLS